ncbi:hypothetical protein TYRP_001557 [Tyrophagus putrescentiae]|nr:hypothetical protein TYRP_001557 [Tyrophagus putrescentiae]
MFLSVSKYFKEWFIGGPKYSFSIWSMIIGPPKKTKLFRVCLRFLKGLTVGKLIPVQNRKGLLPVKLNPVHERRVKFPEAHSRVPKQPGRQPTQVHLGADVRAHADHGEHVRRFHFRQKTAQIEARRRGAPKIEPPRKRLVHVPREVRLDGVYSGRLESLQCLPPVGVVDAKVVQRAAVDDQRTAVEGEVVGIVRLKTGSGGSVLVRAQHASNSRGLM